ncbi:MAG: hypothetical protein HY244_16390 [Rhizobiales bacterium]|nr:hypothetical protein [Hyphomicrobiales bacterium]
MTDQSIRQASRVVDLTAFLPWLVAAGIYVLLLVLGPRLLADPDTYSHIALGRWIMQHQALPDGDPFSHTMRGAHWVAFEWLSQLVYANAYALGGWVAVVAVAAAASAAAFGQMTRFLLREWQPTPTLIVVLAAFVLAAPHTLARPHMLALPLMATWVAAMLRAVDNGRPPPWRLLPLLVLWSNLHGSITFGLAIIGPIALDAIWNAPRAERLRVARQWVLFGLAALAAACVNPYGPEILLVTLRTIALGDVLSVVTEWRPQDFSKLGAYEMIVLAGFGFALYRGIKLPPLRIVWVFGLLHLSLSQSRHADLFALLAPMFLARPLAHQFGTAAGRIANDVRVAAWLPATAALLLIAVTGFAAARNDMRPAANISPVNAVKAFDVAKSGNVLNEYNFGGYLDFVGIPPFIDGRAEAYGAAFTMRHDRALKLENVGDFLRLLDEYKIGVTLLMPSTPAVGLLDRLPEWQRVYSDNIAVVHVRRTN